MHRTISREPSLRRELLLRLWAPLAGVLVAGAAVAFALAVHFGNVVHDRWLLDSALTLATQVRSEGSGPTLDLPRSAVEMFEWDSLDRIYEQVTSPQHGRVFGNADLPPPPTELVPNEPVYYDAFVAGNPVRVVAIVVADPRAPSNAFTVQVAETKRKRQALVAEIMLVLLPVQAVILAVAGAFIWYAVTSSLRRLDRLAHELRGYDADGFAPLKALHDAPSEVKPLALAIDGLIRKLSEARGAQQRFIANAAHQLRTPLATLQVQTERALRETNPELHAEALRHLLKAVTRMRRVAQQLLTFTRSDATIAPALAMSRVDLAELARETLEQWADAAVDRDMDLGYDAPETSVEIEGEPQLLRELVGNLVDNAIRYGRRGGMVTLGIVPDPFVLYVQDDGPGIAPSERERVVEAFYRSPDAGGDGSGLGLAIAREIAARHGAELTIEQAQPCGTRVSVRFVQPMSRVPARATENAG